jgi:4-hydroxy-2-oxoglutarate aldolase
MSSIDLSGVYPPIPTPFDDRGVVALDRLCENLARWCETELAGFVVLGSNGEAVHLNEREKRSVLEGAREAVPSDRLFIAGTGEQSTRATIELTRQAADLGADAVLVMPPHYYRPKMDTAALERHYFALADVSPVPILLYNMPAYTGIDLSAAQVVRLAQHPHIVGLKDSSGHLPKIGAIIGATPRGFQVLAGSASFLYPAMVLGAVGGVCALANVAPRDCCRLVDLVRAGDHQAAQELQLRLIPPNAAVTSRFGVPGLKQALDWTGYYGGPVRSPLGALAEEEKAELKRVLVAAGLMA